MTGPIPKVTVVAGNERLEVGGRAARIILQVAANVEKVNATPVGRLVANFAHQQVKLELVESLPPVRLETPPIDRNASDAES